MFSAQEYIERSVFNQTGKKAEYSQFFVAQSAVVGANQDINQTFNDENILFFFITNLTGTSLVNPTPTFSISDIYGNVLINFNTVGGGIGNLGNFFYIIPKNTLFIRCNNVNIQFAVQFQKVFASVKS